MKNFSERSFGQRLSKARQLLEVLKSIPDYKAHNDMLSIDAFSKLMEETEISNNHATQAKVQLSLKRELRKELYYGLNGLLAIAKRIRDYVASMSVGKNSIHYKNIVAECQKMTGSKTSTIRAKTPFKGGEIPVRKISSSEKSFGSTLQSAKNILTQITLIESYEPSPDLVSKQKLLNAISSVETANMEVQQESVKVNELIALRALKYEGSGGLHDCFQKIKLHLAAAFGKESNIYLEAARIKI